MQNDPVFYLVMLKCVSILGRELEIMPKYHMLVQETLNIVVFYETYMYMLLIFTVVWHTKTTVYEHAQITHGFVS